MELISATTNEVLDVPFTTTSNGFWIYGEGLQAANNERVYVKFTPNAAPQVLTNKAGAVFAGQYPNLVYVAAPAGNYLLCKTASQNPSSGGILGA